MRMVDLIEKTKAHQCLNEKEIAFIVEGFSNGSIPDYQMSAWMMAVCFNGLSDIETAILTKEMMNSGKIIDFVTNKARAIKADKTSRK